MDDKATTQTSRTADGVNVCEPSIRPEDKYREFWALSQPLPAGSADLPTRTVKLFDRVTELLEVGLTPRSEVRYLLRLQARLLRRLAR